MKNLENNNIHLVAGGTCNCICHLKYVESQIFLTIIVGRLKDNKQCLTECNGHINPERILNEAECLNNDHPTFKNLKNLFVA